MPLVKITIESLGQKEVPVTPGQKSALNAIHAAGVDWMHSCGAKGRCTTCKMIVLEGQEHLTVRTAAEEQYASKGLLKGNERLACQTRVTGDIRVRVPKESRLAHLHYTD